MPYRENDGTISGFTDTLEIVHRVPQREARFTWITHKKKRYQLFEPHRVPFFWINLSNPIKARKA